MVFINVFNFSILSSLRDLLDMLMFLFYQTVAPDGACWFFMIIRCYHTAVPPGLVCCFICFYHSGN